MIDLFSNREIAIGIWVTVFALWAASHADTRSSFGQVAKALVNKYIVWILFWTTVYVLVIIAVLVWVGLWEVQNLKITAYWFLSEAAIAVFRGTQETSNPNFFRQAVRDNIKLVVMLEYVVNLYSFNIVVELLIFPFITFVVLLQAFSEGKDKYASIQTPLNVLLATYLLALLIHAVYRVFKASAEIAVTDAASDLLLPPLLSIAFLPFMYLLLTYFAYGQVFSRIQFSLPEELMEDAKRRSFRRFRGDRLLLLRWARILSYTDIKNKDQLINSIDNATFMKWREEHSSIVTFRHGWSPGNAADYLSSLGISAGDYNPSFDGIWTASSEYFSLKDESPILCNNIAYYIYGEQSYVRQLKLMLNVNQPDAAGEAHRSFLKFCDALAGRALDRALSPEVRKAVLVGDNRCEFIRERTVIVERHDWAGNVDGAYEVKFEICHPDFERK